MKKDYQVPEFVLVSSDDTNRVFFVASGAAPKVSGSFASGYTEAATSGWF